MSGTLDNSLFVLAGNGGLIALTLAAILWGSLISFAALLRNITTEIDTAALAALALAGWPVPLLLLAVTIFVLTRLLPLQIAGGITLGLVLLTLLGAVLSLRRVRGHISRSLLLPPVIFLLFAFLRLGYVAEVVLPPYFDSAFHFSLIRSILEMERGAALVWPVQGWYHPGYHLITAGLASMAVGTVETQTRLMLVFGQLILAALPLPLYSLVRAVGGSRTGGWVAVALAGLAWTMPGHAVDWGKYPALLGLLMAEFALGAALLEKWRAAGIALLAAPLIHTRALILLTLAAGAWGAARLKGRILTALALALLTVELLWLLRDPSAAAALTPYLAWGSLPLLALAVPAFRAHPRAALAALLAAAVLPAAMLVPLPGGLTLLDRPFVELALFIPLAFLGGLGADRLSKGAVGVGFVLLVVYACGAGHFRPSPCCQIAGRDDLAAMDWIQNGLPRETLIGIASADLQVSPAGGLLRGAATDGGVWIAPLTDRPVRRLPYSTNFHQPETREMLCAEKVAYLYVGGGPLSFPLETSEGYRLIFTRPGVHVLEVICPPSSG